MSIKRANQTYWFLVIEAHDEQAVTPLKCMPGVLDMIPQRTLELLVELDLDFRRDVFANYFICDKRLVINLGKKLAGIEYKWVHDKSFDLSIIALVQRLGKKVEDLQDINVNPSGTLTQYLPHPTLSPSLPPPPPAPSSLEDDPWRFGFWVEMKA